MIESILRALLGGVVDLILGFFKQDKPVEKEVIEIEAETDSLTTGLPLDEQLDMLDRLPRT